MASPSLTRIEGHLCGTASCYPWRYGAALLRTNNIVKKGQTALTRRASHSASQVSLETVCEELTCKAGSLACSKRLANPFHRQGCWAHAGNTHGRLVRIWGENVWASPWQWGQIKSKSKSWFLNFFHVKFFSKEKKPNRTTCAWVGEDQKQKESFLSLRFYPILSLIQGAGLWRASLLAAKTENYLGMEIS